MNIIRSLIFPFLFTAHFFSKKIKERLRYEKKNDFDFQLEKEAQTCLFFSSEGELEQVIPLFEKLIEDDQSIDLVGTSESVESKALRMVDRYKGRVRFIRLPVLHHLLFRSKLEEWMTAKKVVVVRYDFTPEVVSLIKMKPSLLLWAMPTRLEAKNYLIRKIETYVYNLFDGIVYATKDEEYFGKKSLIHKDFSHTADFRVTGVLQRVSKRDDKLRSLTFIDDYKKLLELYPKEKRIIIANYWGEESEIVQGISDDYLVVIVPHLVDDQTATENCKKLKISQYVDHHTCELDERTSFFYFNLKGILCELYSDFGHAYIGGGFGESIHSILEPFLSGCYCYYGPVNHRSTELKLAKKIDSQRLYELQSLNLDIRNYHGGSQSLDISEIERNNKESLSLVMDWIGNEHRLMHSRK